MNLEELYWFILEEIDKNGVFQQSRCGLFDYEIKNITPSLNIDKNLLKLSPILVEKKLNYIDKKYWVKIRNEYLNNEDFCYFFEPEKRRKNNPYPKKKCLNYIKKYGNNLDIGFNSSKFFITFYLDLIKLNQFCEMAHIEKINFHFNRISLAADIVLLNLYPGIKFNNNLKKLMDTYLGILLKNTSFMVRLRIWTKLNELFKEGIAPYKWEGKWKGK